MKLFPILLAASIAASAAPHEPTGSGVLERHLPDGRTIQSPLKHTAVEATISGPMAEVTVRQEFVNESSTAIEAVYSFPLPVMAAVHGYQIRVGDRVIHGKIARREDAQRAYDEARRRGQTAALLNQERPNIFQQFLANIMPGAKISVELQYVELVPYEAGTYSFVFPTVVGPRYFPQGMTNTNPPVAAKGMRAGHDIAIRVKLATATPLGAVESESHAVTQKRFNQWFEEISLTQANEIPNKDFILKYRIAAPTITPSLLTHRTGKDGYFSFVIDPPAIRTLEANITPKELVFVIDTSGSMHGFPLDKAKEAMLAAIDGLNSRDTFNLITFSGDTEILWPRPVPATPENIAQARRFLQLKNGGGGTEMMKAIRAALDPSDSQEHIRVVCFMTDGYVGNDNEIIAEIRKHSNARIFSFGIGSSVNRFLLDKMAEVGRGEVEYVTLNSDGSAAARRFHERVRNPILTDIQIDFGGLPVADVVPARIPDLFSAKPLIVSGRYTGAASGRIRITGRAGVRNDERFIEVNLPATQAQNPMVPTLWARRKIDSLSIDSTQNREAITKLGLEHHLMTAFTSFYAVEDRVVNEGGVSRTVEVPVELPEGVNHDTTVGRQERMMVKMMASPLPTVAEARADRQPMIALMVNVKILLKDALTPAVLQQLKNLGFIPNPGPANARFLTGSVNTSHLQALRKHIAVLRVEEVQ